MNDPACEALNFILGRYGVTIVDTPRSLATLLKQHAKAVPQDVDALMAAIEHGVVQLIRDDPAHDPASLARVLVMHGTASEAKAQWAVAAWTDALAHANAPDTEPKSSPATSRFAAAFAAAAAGVAAYWMWGR